MTTTNQPSLQQRLAKLPPEKRKQLLAELARRKQQAQSPPPITPIATNGDQWALSFAQQRLWFLDQFTPASSAYNIPAAVRLTGPLDIAALEYSLNAIVSRHLVLRQVYTTVDEEAALILHPDPTIYLNSEAVTDAELQSHINAAAAQLFDLSADMPLRAKLLCLSPTEHVLLLTMHHIASDGWSMSLLFKELSAFYNSNIAEETANPPLPPLTVQYADYAAWQHAWLSGDVIEKQLTYWQKQLQGAPTTLDLLTDHPRPPVRSYVGAIHNFELSNSMSTAITAAARTANVSLYMFLLTGLHILLHHYTGKEDILVGSPVAGRSQRETEALIGLFLNTIVLRSRMAGDPTAAELLQQMRRTTLDAFDHQTLPFEKLVDALKLDRNLSHNPLIQVMFNVHNTPSAEIALSNLSATLLPTEVNTAKFDLNISFADLNGRLHGSISYNSDLFELATIERMAGHFTQLLGSMVADLNRPISQLPLMTAAEKAWLHNWNNTAKAYPPVNSMITFFEAQAARTPDATAIIFEGDSYSYRELNVRANQLAHHLQALGAGREVCVGLLLERSLEMMVGLLGILKAGAAYVPLDPSYPSERIQLIADEAQISALVSDSERMAGVSISAETIILIDRDWSTISQQPSNNLNLPIAPSDQMYTLFTSGSTGKPKGVVVENRNYVSYFQAVFERMDVPNGLSYAVATTFATDLGSIMFWSALASGGQVHIISYERATDPSAFAAYFRQHEIDVLKLVPSHFDALRLLGDSAEIIPNRLLILAGETSYWETVRDIQRLKPSCTVQDHYGVTETTGIMLTYTVPPEGPDSGPLPKGRPLANTRLYVLDKQRQPVPLGVPGEIYIAGEGVTRGYLNQPELTDSLFVPDCFSETPGRRMYRTGDLAALQADGTLRLLGRSDFQVKIRGYRVELGEIENVLNKMATLERCVVMAQTDAAGDSRLVAYVGTTNQAISAASLRQTLRDSLPDHMVPSSYVILDQLPLNANGKIDRPALRTLDLPQVKTSADIVAPRNDSEQQLADIWCAVLGIDKVSIDDNFFDVGGDSFKAIRVVRRVGETVSVMNLFQNPTIRELAVQLAADEPHQSRLLYELTRPLTPAKRRYALVCVPYGGGSAAVYHPLAQSLPDDVSLYSIAIPGHDFSQQQEAHLPFDTLVDACVAEIEAHVAGPIVLYGHCVGSALAVAIGRKLEAHGRSLQGVLLGGNFPSPRLKQFEFFHTYLPLARWTSSRLIYEAMRGVGGFTDVIDSAEQTFVIENMRHDVRQASDFYTAHNTGNDATLAAPICCVVAEQDPATEFYQERAADWLDYSDSVSMQIIPNAGHYFLKHQAPELGNIINEQVQKWQQPTATAPATIAPVHTPSFNIFLLIALGQLVSMVGTGLTTFTLGVWALEASNSLVNFTIISIFALLPGILVSPFAGAAADRYDRRKVMIASDVLAACSTLIIAALLWTDALQVWHIYVTASIGSIANAFQQPAYIAAIAQLVPKRHLGRANGIAQLSANTGRVLAPLLGGLLYVVFSLSTVVIIDFLTFLFAVGTLLFVRFPNNLFRRREEPFMQELLGGWHYIRRRPSMVAMVVFMVVFNFLSSFTTVLMTPLVLAFDSVVTLGSVMSAFGLGLISGALAMSLWGGMRRRAEGLILFTSLSGLAIMVIGWRPNVTVLGVGLFALGVFFALIDSHWQSIIQTKVGFALQGRVVSINQMLVWAMMPLGFLLAGVLTDGVVTPLLQPAGSLGSPLSGWFGYRPGWEISIVFLAIGLLQVMWGVIGWFNKRLRFMEDALPDAVPDAVVAADRNQIQQLADQKLLEGIGV